MQPVSRATLGALLLSLSLSAPATVLAAPAPEDAPTAAVNEADDDDTVDAGTEDAPEEAADDTSQAADGGGASTATDPFCPPAPTSADAPDDVVESYDGDAADDVQPVTDETPGEVLDADVADEPVAAAKGAVDFCLGTPVAAAPLSLSLSTVRRRASITPATLSVAAPGTIVRELTLSRRTTAKALRRYRSSTLGTARRVVASDGLIELPVKLNAKGRKALRAAGREVILTVTTTQRLASGQRRTRTQALVLRRGR